MAIREDVTIDWSVSPRIIQVAAPSVTIKVQDLYDTVRSLAATMQAMDDTEIIDAGGTESLTDTERVCITVTLLNAKLKFEPRSTWTICTVESGNLLAKNVSGASMSPIEPSAYVNTDRAKSTSGTLIQIATIDEIKTTVDNMPSVLSEAHGSGSWEGIVWQGP